MMSTFHVHDDMNWPKAGPIPFPSKDVRDSMLPRQRDSVQYALLALGLADRRMKQLARTLGCLGHFESGEDGPRAA